MQRIPPTFAEALFLLRGVGRTCHQDGEYPVYCQVSRRSERNDLESGMRLLYFPADFVVLDLVHEVILVDDDDGSSDDSDSVKTKSWPTSIERRGLYCT
jgi:hypothetical protein